MQLLSLHQLRQLHTERLYWLLRHVRSVVDGMIPPDWSDDEPDIRLPAYRAYLSRIKQVVQERPYVSYSKSAKARRRREQLSNLKGNRNQLRNRKRRKAVSFRHEETFTAWTDSWGV